MNKLSILLSSLIAIALPLISKLANSQIIPTDRQIPNNTSTDRWETVIESGDTILYKRDRDYLLAIDLSRGASIGFIHGKITDIRRGKGAYGGDEPRFLRQTVAQTWSNLSPSNPDLFCLTNGQFFRNDRNSSTGLAFPVKSQGKVVSDGYAGEIEFAEEKLMLAVWDNRAEILPFHPVYLRLSTAPEIIVGLKEDADKGIFNETGRTFIGVKDRDGDRINETVLIFTTKKATQPRAAAVLKSFGATAAMMLDGGGSTQLFCRGNSYVRSARTIPQAIAVFSAAQE